MLLFGNSLAQPPPGSNGTRRTIQTAMTALWLQVFLDVGIASSAFKAAGERTLGDKTVLPRDAEPAGRIVIGTHRSAGVCSGSLTPSLIWYA